MAVMNEYLDEIVYDLSHCKITGHAMSQYANKCKQGLTFIEINQTMRENLKTLRKVSLLNKKERKEYNKRETFLDKEGNIYVIEKDIVITTFPNERIFIAKTMYSNRKTGQKYL